MEKGFSDTLLIGFDHSNGDHPVLIVGRKGKDKDIQILNACQNEMAIDIYNMLTSPFKEEKHE